MAQGPEILWPIVCNKTDEDRSLKQHSCIIQSERSWAHVSTGDLIYNDYILKIILLIGNCSIYE